MVGYCSEDRPPGGVIGASRSSFVYFPESEPLDLYLHPICNAVMPVETELEGCPPGLDLEGIGDMISGADGDGDIWTEEDILQKFRYGAASLNLLVIVDLF